jgi:hypothetical protein
MSEDEVVREVRAAREVFAASHEYDVQAMVAALRALDDAGGRAVVRFAPRPAVLAGKTVGPSLIPGESGPLPSVTGTS